MVLGMIPDCPLEKVYAAGNAAGTGARIALLDQKTRDQIETVIRQVEKIETAVEPKFQEHFVEAMGLPHSSAPFPNLEKAVTLPKPKAPPQPANDEASQRRRRRRERSR